MSIFQTAISIFATVVLFLHGLQGFSREFQEAGAGTFQALITRLTKSRYRGFMLGAVVTALIQSSSAVSSITVALVDSGAITFRNSLGILLGANVGTTSTAWLVSFKLTGIGPVFIVAGTLVSLLPRRGRVVGKAVFYFGLVLFALDLLSASLTPLREAPILRELLGATASLPLAVLIGIGTTALVQSSSVTSGLAVLLTQQGALAPDAAIALVVGANVGTTSTALVASAAMSSAAKRAARANLFFNVAGVAAVVPWLDRYAALVLSFEHDPAMSVAWAHLAFNFLVAIPFLVLLRPFERLILKLWPPSSL
jgi:phosphate:Na+ symporter